MVMTYEHMLSFLFPLISRPKSFLVFYRAHVAFLMAFMFAYLSSVYVYLVWSLTNYKFIADTHIKYVILTRQKGAHSATITSNFLSVAAFLRKASTDADFPRVMIISFEWICCLACWAMLSALQSKQGYTS